MIPDWATHVGIHHSTPGVYLVYREGYWYREGLGGGWTRAWTKGLSIRPITPEMRREALVADERIALDAWKVATAANETAQEKWNDAMGRLRAFDREHGTGDDK
jgi:hypothetical protein